MAPQRDASGRFIKGSGGGATPPVPDFGKQGARGIALLRAHAASLSSPATSPLLRGMATDLMAKLTITLSQAGSGREYPRGSKVHRASRPGQPPAPDSGDLVGSVGQEIGMTSIRVGVGMPYGAALEFGTARIQPRPFMRPALKDVLGRWRGAKAAAVLRGKGFLAALAAGRVPDGN